MNNEGPLAKMIRLWALFGGALLLVIVLLTAINVAGFTANAIARLWGGNFPGLSGYEDAVTLFVGVAGLSLFPYCQLTNGHAAVDVFMEKAPVWANRFIAVLSAGLVVILALYLSYMLVQGTLQIRADGIETPGLGWPVWIFLPSAVISCLLWALAAASQFVTHVRGVDGI